MLVRSKPALLVCGLVMIFSIEGCQAPRGGSGGGYRRYSKHKRILSVRCLYEQKPWLSLDKAGDRDPEGLRYRVFLDTGTGRGILAKGVFHIQMYHIASTPQRGVERTLVSDWHYSTDQVHTIAKPGLMGDGYFVYLMWASKDIAGQEIEVVTEFEDTYGQRVRSGTKRLRVPKYAT